METSSLIKLIKLLYNGIHCLMYLPTMLVLLIYSNLLEAYTEFTIFEHSRLNTMSGLYISLLLVNNRIVQKRTPEASADRFLLGTIRL